MSFLAPLYALGVLAVSLPIVFHLIRRTPRGRVLFSSLMFLTPSPPRIKRRSRLEHWLLLLLRAAALVLLALAFARPFFRETAQLGLLNSQTRKVAILIDTSASMRRGDSWQRAMEHSNKLLNDLRPTDDVALFAFDSQLRRLVDFDNQSVADPQARRAAVQRQLNQLRPTWGSSNLGEALATLADQMDTDADRNQSDAALQIQLFSDIQEGTRLESLQSYDWPSRVHVQVHDLSLTEGNAGIHEMLDLDDDAQQGSWRVRVVNDSLAKRDRFHLRWLDDSGKPLDEFAARNIYVPAGEHRVLRLTPPTGREVAGVELVDDPFDFDNTLYLSQITVPPIRVLYAGGDAADDVRGMRYYLQQALEADPRRDIQYTAIATDQITTTALADVQLVVLATAPSAAVTSAIQQFASAGGWVVAALPAAEQYAALGTLLGIETFQAREVALKESEYVMLTDIDFDHPLFARLADARYSDFTKIRFWKMREFNLGQAGDGLQVLASFDNHLPAIVQRAIGKGGLLLLTSTWSPDDSQLALSTKFVPLVAGWLNAASPLPQQPPRLFTGQPLRISAPFDAAQPLNVRSLSGTVQQFAPTEVAELPFDEPGAYVLTQGDVQQTLAVNVPVSESRTSPLDPSVLEQYGVLLGKAELPQLNSERQRQLRDQELEKRQKLWRWLIATALVVLTAETWLAGYTRKRVELAAVPGTA